jgi:hypothetical protein
MRGGTRILNPQSPIRRLVVALATFVLAANMSKGAQIVYPVADGTLVDGGSWGNYDGVADAWNWTFGPAGFAGAITLATETPTSAVQHRMVFEYDLRSIDRTTPIEATLTFAVRGVRVVPFPDVVLHVYSYPADLIESPSDFSAGPAVLRGVFTVAANQDPKTETLDVTGLVTSALQSGNKRVAFRFQIDPNTPHPANQVFLNVLDTQPTSKPFLTIRSAVPGDADDDGDADLNDFAVLTDCLAGPAALPTPSRSGVSREECLRVFDRDADEDVDVADLSALLGAFTPDN